ITAVGKDLYFFAHDPSVSEYELWFSDGTSGGTRRLRDLTGGPVPRPCPTTSVLERLGDTLYFGADDGVAGCELWSLCVGGLPNLLRNTDATSLDLPPRAREILPLRYSRDRYSDDIVSGRVDPPPIVEDATRPLVFYEIDEQGPVLKLLKTPSLGILIEL